MASKERMLAESNNVDDECEEGEIKDDSSYEDLSSDDIFTLNEEKYACVDIDRSGCTNHSSAASRSPRTLNPRARKMSSHIELLQEKENRDSPVSIVTSKLVPYINIRKRSHYAFFQESPRRHHSLFDKIKRRRHNNTDGRQLQRCVSDVAERTHTKKKHNSVSHHKIKAIDGQAAKLKKRHKESNFNENDGVSEKRVKVRRSHKIAGLVGQHFVSASTSLRRRLQNMGVTLPTLDLSTISESSSTQLLPPSPPPQPPLLPQPPLSPQPPLLPQLQLLPQPPLSPQPPLLPQPPPQTPPELLSSPPPLTSPLITSSLEHLCTNTTCADIDNDIIVLPIPEKPPVEVIDIVSSPEVEDSNSLEPVYPSSISEEVHVQVALENEEKTDTGVPENNDVTDNAAKEADCGVPVEDEEVLQLRLIALRSAILKKHQNRQKRRVPAKQNQQDFSPKSPDPQLTSTENVSSEEPDEITTLVDMELADTDEEKEPSEEDRITVNVPLAAPDANAQLTWDQSCAVFGPQLYPLPASYVGYDACGMVPYCAQPIGIDLYNGVPVAESNENFTCTDGKENFEGPFYMARSGTSSSSISANCISVPQTCKTMDHLDEQLVVQASSDWRPEDEVDDVTTIDMASMIVIDEVGPEEDGQANIGDVQDEEDEELLRAKLLHTMLNSKQKRSIPESVSHEISAVQDGYNPTEHIPSENFNPLSLVDGSWIEINQTVLSTDTCVPVIKDTASKGNVPTNPIVMSSSDTGVPMIEDTTARANVPTNPIVMSGPVAGAPIPTVQNSFHSIQHRAMQARRGDRMPYSKKQLARALRYTRKKVNLVVPNKSQSLKVTVPMKATSHSSQRFVICLKDDEESDDSADEAATASMVSEPMPELEERINMFLKQARMSQEAAQKLEPTTNKTPLAVRHLPQSQQEEYRRLKDQVMKLEEMNKLRRLQLISASTKSLSPVHPVAGRVVKPPDGTVTGTGASEKAARKSGAERMVTATNKLTVTISQPRPGVVPASSNAIASNSIVPKKTHTLGRESSLGVSKSITSRNFSARKTLFEKITNKESRVVKAQPRQPSFGTTRVISPNISPKKQFQQLPHGSSSVASQFGTVPKQVNVGTKISVGNNLKQMSSSSSSSSSSSPNKKLINGSVIKSPLKSSLTNTSVPLNRHLNEKVAGSSGLAETDGANANVRVEKRVVDNVHTLQVAQKSSELTTEPVQSLVGKELSTHVETTKPDASVVIPKTAEKIKEQKKDSYLTENSGSQSMVRNLRQETTAKVVPAPAETLQTVTDTNQEFLCNLEHSLHAQRCRVLDGMTDTWDLLRRMELGQEEEEACVAEVARLRTELRRAEQRLQAQRKDVAGMRALVRQSYGRVKKGKEACKELAARCLSVGSSLRGTSYRVPTAREELMVAKLRQISEYTRRISKKRILSTFLPQAQVDAEPSSKRSSRTEPSPDTNGLNTCPTVVCDEPQVPAKEPSAPSCSDPCPGPDTTPGSEPSTESQEDSPNAKAPRLEQEDISSEPAAADAGDCAGGTVPKESRSSPEATVVSREHRGSVLGLEDNHSGAEQRASGGWRQPACHFWPSDSKWAGKIDPGRPLCPYELRGSCRDQECLYQHVWGVAATASP